MKSSNTFPKPLIAFLFAIIFIVSISASFAQNHTCGTTIDEQVSTYEHVKNKAGWLAELRSPNPFIVPLQFHIIGANNGAFALDSALVFDELARMNVLYADANIQFTHCGVIHYIYDNDYLTFIKNVDELLCDIHDVVDAINIYFAPSVERTDGEGICGYAYNYDIKQRVIMDNGCSTNGSTLAHELGHSFSLLHTHSSSFGQELVDGSNCFSAGDMICDTPADPRLSSDIVNSSCVYTGTELDPQNQPYMPEPRNVMSYSRKSCRTMFSPDQQEQMQAYHMSFQDRLTCVPDTSISSTVDRPFSEVFITPNPCRDFIYLTNLTASATVSLFNMNGQLIWEKQTVETSGAQALSMIGVNSGLYYLYLTNGRQFEIKRIIKM